MSETNGNGIMAEKIADGKIEPAVLKKPRIDDSVEERDFDEETQKALEEIDANQNEIDALNERKFNYRYHFAPHYVIVIWSVNGIASMFVSLHAITSLWRFDCQLIHSNLIVTIASVRALSVTHKKTKILVMILKFQSSSQ